MESIQIKTSRREELVNITSELQALVKARGWDAGCLLVYCPHTTGAVTVNEAADPSVMRDISVNLSRFIPRQGDYRHMEGNSDAHIKSSLVGNEQWLILENGSIQLGTWQGVFFCEFDGPRTRKVWVKFLAG